MAEIQGKEATDIEERVALSLTKYHWTYTFQDEYFGGKRVLGGQVIDFVVHTLPQPTPVYVQGEYWHPESVLDRDRLQRVLLNVSMQGYFAEPVIIWGIDLETQEESDDTILKIFGRN